MVNKLRFLKAESVGVEFRDLPRDPARVYVTICMLVLERLFLAIAIRLA